MEDEHSLRKWLGHTDLTQYLKDKEVQVLLTSLKERITSLKEVRLACVCFVSTTCTPVRAHPRCIQRTLRQIVAHFSAE